MAHVNSTIKDNLNLRPPSLTMKMNYTIASLVIASALSAANAQTQIKSDFPYVSKIEGSCKDREHTFLMTIQHDAYDSAQYGMMNLYVYDGPLGKGDIPSRVSYEQARAYVCKEPESVTLFRSQPTVT